MNKAIYCLLLCWFWGYPMGSHAQKSHLAINAIHLPKHIADNNIQMALRDDSGLIWFVTDNGLYRYDGSELLHFGIGTTPALPSLTITTLSSDHQGNLWLGFSDGAARFDLKSWSISPLYLNTGYLKSLNPHDRRLSTVACLGDGEIYYGTKSGKLLKVHGDSLVQIADLGIGKAGFMPTGPPTPEPSIENIQEPIKGQLWLTTGDGMLVSIQKNPAGYEDPVCYKFAAVGINGITNACYDRSGKCLLSFRDKGIFRSDIQALYRDKKAHPGSVQPRDYSKFIQAVPLPDSVQENNYSLLFYVPGGQPGILTMGKGLTRYIFMYDFASSKWWRNAKPYMAKYPGELIHGISSQPSGRNAYICSGGGLTAIHAEYLPFDMQLNSEDNINSIRAIYASGDSVYIGSYQQYLLRYNRQTGEVKPLQTLYVYSILPWNKDTLLIGSEGAGLCWYEPSINKLTHIGLQLNVTRKASVYQSKFITVLSRVNPPLVLEGTTRGLHLVDPLHKKLYPVFSNASAQNMQAVKINALTPYPFKNNAPFTQFLVGTDAGAFVTNSLNGQTRYLFADSISADIKRSKVHGFAVIGDQIWIATSGLGVLAVDFSGKINYMEWLNSKLTSPTVYSMAKSGTHLLIGTNKGLNIVDLKDSSVASYQGADGMHSDEFNQASSFTDGQQIYLGTINGVICWNKNTARHAKQTSPLAIRINKLTIADKNNHLTTSYRLAYLPPDSCQIRIPASTRYFSITFDNPETQSKTTPYYYRLGPTESWINIGSHREITFNKMTPGNYTLQLSHNINGKLKQSAIFQIPITILPAYYQTLLFKILVLLLITGILLLIIRLRQNQQNKERNLRTKIAGDLHDEIGSSLTRIWHQAQRLQTDAIAPPPPHQKQAEDKKLQHIADTSQEAIAMLSDMVWSIDAQFDTIEELIIRMKTYIYQLQNEFDIPVNMTFTNLSKEKKVSQIVRQNIFLVFKEGINNAIKYGNGALINIDITISTEAKIKIKMTNNFNRAAKSTGIIGGRGIVNMQRRVKNMNGELIVESEENIFTLIITV
ncbi:sensor histidine kinase [Arachidicoccus ginsenosidivorans]